MAHLQHDPEAVLAALQDSKLCLDVLQYSVINNESDTSRHSMKQLPVLLPTPPKLAQPLKWEWEGGRCRAGVQHRGTGDSAARHGTWSCPSDSVSMGVALWWASAVMSARGSLPGVSSTTNGAPGPDSWNDASKSYSGGEPT